MSNKFESWGRYPKATQDLTIPEWEAQIPLERNSLPVGLGRSYGDSCQNDGGRLVSCNHLSDIESFDPRTGIVTCQAGTSLEQIINFCLPHGWFLPVSPGTKYVTVAGAIANDIHGKNHHKAGTFGCHVLSFELLRSDGSLRTCSLTEHPELFKATIGGLGLTGFIRRATVQLKKVTSANIQVESVKFRSLDEFLAISAESEKDFEYTVSWVDCLDANNRGIFMRGNHAKDGQMHVAKRKLPIAVPFDMPSWFLGPTFVRLFNDRFFNKQKEERETKTVSYEPYFYPLDAVQKWNRIYGKRGFLQFQCVVPKTANNAAIREIFDEVVKSGRASFLAVLKEFGSIRSPGLMSFPRPGITLCLDFPMEGKPTLELFDRINQIVAECGGAQYPAKDATMTAAQFQTYYPQWRDFSKYIDPNLTSSFWRRVTKD